MMKYSTKEYGSKKLGIKEPAISRMGTLYMYELKKIINRKIVWITFLIMVILHLFISYSNVIFSSHYEDSEYVSGFAKLKSDKASAQAFSGKMIDDAFLLELQDFHGKEAPEYYTPVFSCVQQIADNSYIQRVIGDSNFTFETDARKLYEKRALSISQNRSDQMLTKKEYDYWEEKDARIKTPFTYEYTDSWNNLWSYAGTLNYMILLTLSICLSSVFSIEHTRKTNAIILCSRYGKRHLYCAKMLAGITFGAVTAVLLFGTFMFSNISVYGTDGFHAALQLVFPLSTRAMSIGASIALLFFLLLIISMLYSVVIMVLSEAIKSGVIVMAIQAGFLILTMLFDIPYQFRAASQIYDLLPTNLLLPWELWDDRLVPVFGTYMTNLQFAPVLYLISAVVLFVIGKHIYQKAAG